MRVIIVALWLLIAEFVALPPLPIQNLRILVHAAPTSPHILGASSIAKRCLRHVVTWQYTASNLALANRAHFSELTRVAKLAALIHESHLSEYSLIYFKNTWKVSRPSESPEIWLSVQLRIFLFRNSADYIGTARICQILPMCV